MKKVNKLYYIIIVILWLSCSDRKIEIFDDYSEGIENASEHNQQILLIFDFYGNPTRSVEKKIQNKYIKPLLSSFSVILLKVDDTGDLNNFNSKLQKEKYKTNYQPAYYIIDKTETIIKGPLGYCSSSELQNFLVE